MGKNPIQIEPIAASGEFRVLCDAVPADMAGQRVDGYLSENFPFFSRASWQKRIKQGVVVVNEREVRPSHRLGEADRIDLYYPTVIEPEVDRGIYPLWKMGDVMAVYKPANLPMHENGPYRKNTFAEIVKEELGQEWAAVHRLDKETSGIVLCGATHKVRQVLSKSLAQRTLAKEYVAICKGSPDRASWVERGAIGDCVDSPIRIKKWVVESGGLSAETSFVVLGEKDGYIKLAAFPTTGRTNQIRIHAAYADLPLVGDKLYHPDESVFLDWFDHGMTEKVVHAVEYHRCLLHAKSITFLHPENESIQRIDCPMPEDMETFWQDPLKAVEKVKRASGEGGNAVADPRRDWIVQLNKHYDGLGGNA